MLLGRVVYPIRKAVVNSLAGQISQVFSRIFTNVQQTILGISYDENRPIFSTAHALHFTLIVYALPS